MFGISRKREIFFGRMLGATYLFARDEIPRWDTVAKIAVAEMPYMVGGRLRDSIRINRFDDRLRQRRRASFARMMGWLRSEQDWKTVLAEVVTRHNGDTPRDHGTWGRVARQETGTTPQVLITAESSNGRIPFTLT